MPDTALRPLTAAEATLQFATADVRGPGDIVAWRIAADGTPLWWMSFVDPEIARETPEEDIEPGGPAFLGALIVAAPTLAEAFIRSHELDANPGGSVLVAGPIPADAVDPAVLDRLLTRDETLAIPDDLIESALNRYVPESRPAQRGVCPACGFASIPLLCSKCGHTRPGRGES